MNGTELARKVYRRGRRVAARARSEALTRTAVPRNYTYLDPLDLPAIDRETVLNGSRTGVWYEDGPANRAFERITPSFVDDPDNVRLFSEAELVSCDITYPPGLTVSGRNVTLIGYRQFLTRDRRFFTDDALLADRRNPWLETFDSPHPTLNEDTQFRRKDYRDMFTLRRNLLQAEHIPGRAVALVHQEPLIYGSWLFRVVTKLSSLERLGLMDEKVLACMLYPTFKDLLVIGGLNPDRLIQHDPRRMYRFDHVVVPGNRNGHCLLDNESKAVFAKLRDKVGYSRTNRRIYVARNKPGEGNIWNGRVMQNEAELIERLTPLGFEVVVPAKMTMEEQIRTFASATCVIGGSGSAMFNSVFCLPGTKLIDIESEPHWINAHMCLFSSLGLEYGIFVGVVDPADTAAVHRRWRVNIDALVERVHGFMGPA